MYSEKVQYMYIHYIERERESLKRAARSGVQLTYMWNVKSFVFFLIQEEYNNMSQEILKLIITGFDKI